MVGCWWRMWEITSTSVCQFIPCGTCGGWRCHVSAFSVSWFSAHSFPTLEAVSAFPCYSPWRDPGLQSQPQTWQQGTQGPMVDPSPSRQPGRLHCCEAVPSTLCNCIYPSVVPAPSLTHRDTRSLAFLLLLK